MSIKKLLNSFKYAYWGIKRVFKSEQNFQIHTIVSIMVILFSVFVLHFSIMEMIIILFCILIVLTTEIINTAIEYTWNHLEPNHHPVVKAVKDMMAGSVLLSSIFSIIIWIMLIINH